jgi:hypothetical protein
MSKETTRSTGKRAVERKTTSTRTLAGAAAAKTRSKTARKIGVNKAAAAIEPAAPPARASSASSDIPPVPRTRGELRDWLLEHLGVRIAGEALIEGHDAPLDYLEWAFFEEGHPACVRAPGVSDCVVWACRGGGKTFYAAVATLLDLLYKPGVRVMILGGSMHQSQCMHEHLRAFFERDGFAPLVEGKITEKRVRLVNGSVVEVLSHAQTSIRGVRPQKLRCDELDLFDPEVWRAAQLVTRSKECPPPPGEDSGPLVRGGVECFSTWHVRGGLMSEIVAGAGHSLEAAASRRVFKWGVVDVLEPCDESRPCEPCVLLPECAGRAKAGSVSGHLRIDDAVTLKKRADAETWASEMLCLRPATHASVYPQFDRREHGREFDHQRFASSAGGAWVCGMDFGFAAPAVILWAFHEFERDTLWVVGERVRAGALLSDHVGALRESHWPGDGTLPAWIGIDPAGNQRQDQTGTSNAQVLRTAGFSVRSRREPIETGLKLVRARLAPAVGPPRLFIHPRCAKLIDALDKYRYEELRRGSPVKDGPDHAADALRYLVVNLDEPVKVKSDVY